MATTSGDVSIKGIMLEGLTFRRAQKEDLPRISKFRKTLFEYDPLCRSCEPEYYEWKCYKNPVLQGEVWIAEDGNTLVGMKSMTPKKIKILDKVVIGAETGDTFTHPDYQRRGIFTNLFRHAKEIGLDREIGFIYGTPNQNSLPGYILKLNYAQIPIELRSLVKPLCTKRLLQTKLRFSPLASVLSLVIAVVFKTIFTIGTSRIAKSDVCIRQEMSFPNDIAILWEQTSRNYDVALIRTKDYLEWRYVTNPETYLILIARNSNGAILGYMVAKDTFHGDIPTCTITDFLILEEDPNIFKQLLIALFQKLDCKGANIVSVVVVKGSYYDKFLLKAGFIPHNEIPLICYRSEVGNQLLKGGCKWHFTLGDTDNL